MGIAVGIIVLIIIFGTLSSGVGATHWKQWRPYFGLFLIAAVVAILGVILGLVLPALGNICFFTAIWISVAAGVLICLKLIVVVIKNFFTK